VGQVPMTRKLRILHTLVDWFRWTGIRNRLRCPFCSAVGTWKPHGGRWDQSDTRKVRRWLCKWCGYYYGPEGQRWCSVSKRQGCWVLVWDLPDDEPALTPRTVVRRSYLGDTNPWNG
jgi:hypothetical protein